MNVVPVFFVLSVDDGSYDGLDVGADTDLASHPPTRCLRDQIPTVIEEEIRVN